jgi:hypothetical protein
MSKENEMSEITLFKTGLPSYLKNLQEDETTNTLAGGEVGQRRISIKGNVFREMVGNKEIRVSEERAIGVIIVKAAPSVHRTFFPGAYVEGQNASPVCWSSNNQTPDTSVPADQKQAGKCMDCSQNIKGSASQGDGRACRFSQRIAVLIEGETDKREIYQVICPATSVFGDGERGKLPLQAYGRHLKAHNTPVAGVITEMRFDTASPVPKLVFKPVRPITEEEYHDVEATRNSTDAEDAIKLTVVSKPKDDIRPMGDLTRQEDAPVYEKIAAKAAPKAAKVVTEEVEEPKKVEKKFTPAATSAPALTDLVDGWDD